MPRNGSGTYSLPQPAFTPGSTIASAAVNSDFSDIGAALTQSISKDGQTVYTGNQPMGGNKLTGLGNGTAATDSATVGQLTSGAVNYALAAGTDTITIAPSPGISAYAIGQFFRIKILNTNTGAVTLSVNGVGAGAVVWPDGSALVAGDLPAGAMIEVDVQATTPVFHLQTVSAPPIPKGLLTTRGDMIYRNATVPARLAKGAAGTILVAGADDPAWGALSTLTNSLSGDVVLNNTANYFTGPTVAQGTSGTWIATGKVTVKDTAIGATFYAKLWDGTTVIDSAVCTTGGAGLSFPMALSGRITSPAGNLRISVRDLTATTGLIQFDVTGEAKDSTLTVVRIG